MAGNAVQLASSTFHKGNGGQVQKFGVPATANLAIKKWTMEKSIRLTDATHSGTQGYALWKGTVKEASGSATALWNSSVQPETIGMDVGTELILQLKKGDSATQERWPAIIEKLSYDCDNESGLVTYDFSWKNQGPPLPSVGPRG